MSTTSTEVIAGISGARRLPRGKSAVHAQRFWHVPASVRRPRPKVALAIVAAIMLAAGANRLAAQELLRSVPISWDAVAGATRYQLEIRPLHGDVILSQSTTTTSLTVRLAAGHYQLRVTAYNLFDKPATSTEWSDLEVVRVYAPAFTGLETSGLYSGAATGSVTIDGGHFGAHTTVALARDGHPVVPGAIESHNPTRIEATFALASVPPGDFDLLLSNPDNLTTSAPKAVHVLARIQPTLSGESLRSGYNDRVYRQVTVTGAGLSRSTKLLYRMGAEEIPITNLSSSSPERLTFDVDLGDADPGNYALCATNPGGLTATLAGALRVESITAPVVERVTPRRLVIGESDGAFTITGEHFVPQTSVYLVGQKGPLPVLVDPAGGGSIESLACRIDPRFAGAGTYDLVVENSRQLSTRVQAAIEILPYPAPSLSSITPNRGIVRRDYAGVVVRGVNLAPDLKLFLRQGALQLELPAIYVSSSEYRVDLDLSRFAPGSYDLLLGSGNEIVSSLPSIFQVIPPPPVPPPPPTPPPAIVHPQAIRVSAGYPLTVILSNGIAENLALSLTGAQIDTALPVGNRFLSRVPVLNSLGLAIDANYVSFTSGGSGAQADLSLWSGVTSIYYRTPFNFPVNGIVQAGWGMGFTSFSSTLAASAFGGSAIDFLVRLAASAEIDIGPVLTLEPGVSWQRIYSGAASIDTAGLFVRAGVRLGG